MQVILLEETWQFDNHPAAIEQLFQQVNERLQDSEYHFSHMLIDGTEVYENFDDYIVEHIRAIKTIEIKVNTVKEFAHELLLTTEEYIQRATPEISHVINEFYQGPTQETWDKFSQLLEGIQWIHHMLTSIDQSSYIPNNWEQYLKILASLQMELKNLEEALKHQDYILMADIIQYELLTNMSNLDQEIKTTIDHEGYRNDTN